jgi:hypothetical protein
MTRAHFHLSLRLALLLALLLALFLSASTAAAEDPETRRFAVRTNSAELLKDLAEGSFQRWVLPNNKNLELTTGPEATGDVEVLVQVLPADQGLVPLLQGLPVSFGDGSISLGKTRYDNPKLGLAIRLPTTTKPTWVVSGFDVETTAALTDQILMITSGVRWRRSPSDFDYLLWEHSFSQRSGHWQKGEDGTFHVDPLERDDLAARAATYGALKPLEQSHITLRVAPEQATDPRFLALAKDLNRAVARMAQRIPVELKEPLQIVVEKNYETQGRHLAQIGVAVLHEGRLHVVPHPEDTEALHYALARTLVRRAGLSLPPWLEDGAALWLAESWLGRPYGDWLPAFAGAGVLPTANELLAEERQKNSSDVLWPPAAAAVVRALRGTSLKARLATLPEPAWTDKILGQLEHGVPSTPLQKVSKAPAQPQKAAVFQRGISFAMANGLEVGYHAPGIDHQLSHLALLGANSISLMPFAFQRSATGPDLSFRHDHPSSETDVGLVHAARRAHAQGFRVLWKPHIWVSHDSWPGDIAMKNNADWATWWHSYRRFIVHHAVLAEYTGSELFSIGVELGRTLEREAEWAKLIKAVRSVYSGQLTYSGNWWGDYDRATFWPLLDYVGVDAYFPLAPTADADRATLLEGAHRAAQELRKSAQRFGRPILLTEMGFAAREGAWVEPHKEGGTFSETHQKLAYEVFLEALGSPSWLAGLYVWKVFSHPKAEGGERPDFRLIGRQAEGAVKEYFNTVRGSP